MQFGKVSARSKRDRSVLSSLRDAIDFGGLTAIPNGDFVPAY